MFYNRGNEIYKVDFKFEYFSRLEGTVTFFFFYFLLCGQLNGSKRIELIETAWEKRMIAVHVLQKKKKKKNRASYLPVRVNIYSWRLQLQSRNDRDAKCIGSVDIK